MNPYVSFQGASAGKLQITNVASIRSITCVRVHMNKEMIFVPKHLRANFTGTLSLIRVDIHVSLKPPFTFKRGITNFAPERSVITVSSHVGVKTAFPSVLITADLAFVRFNVGVEYRVTSK